MRSKKENCIGISTVDLQVEIGKTSNLITDMGMKGASDEEIQTAVQYSSYLLDLGKLHEKIKELHKKYHCAKKV